MIGMLMAEWRRTVVETVRYPLETISSMATLFIVFAGLFYGATYITNSPIGDGRLTTVVVGYAVWMTMMAATGDLGWSIQNEAQNGTLEQVMMFPWPPVLIFLVRAFMAIVAFVLPMAIVLLGLLAITHIHLQWHWAAVLPFAWALGTAWGLGLIVASIALLFKRIGQVLNIVQFAMLFLILAPIADFPAWQWRILSALMPFTAQVTLLRDVLSQENASLWLWMESGGNFLLIILLGILFFIWANRVARSRGILGHY